MQNVNINATLYVDVNDFSNTSPSPTTSTSPTTTTTPSTITTTNTNGDRDYKS